ncbi:MAG: hypothetical protein KAR07_07845, partial [Spirochaetes bacterium]|nr:hypothetical protein [Spirochaetota bacterium]
MIEKEIPWMSIEKGIKMECWKHTDRPGQAALKAIAHALGTTTEELLAPLQHLFEQEKFLRTKVEERQKKLYDSLLVFYRKSGSHLSKLVRPGLSRSSIGNFLRRKKIDLKYVVLLAEGLNVQIKDLWSEDDLVEVHFVKTEDNGVRSRFNEIREQKQTGFKKIALRLKKGGEKQNVVAFFSGEWINWDVDASESILTTVYSNQCWAKLNESLVFLKRHNHFPQNGQKALFPSDNPQDPNQKLKEATRYGLSIYEGKTAGLYCFSVVAINEVLFVPNISIEMIVLVLVHEFSHALGMGEQEAYKKVVEYLWQLEEKQIATIEKDLLQAKEKMPHGEQPLCNFVKMIKGLKSKFSGISIQDVLSIPKINQQIRKLSKLSEDQNATDDKIEKYKQDNNTSRRSSKKMEGQREQKMFFSLIRDSFSEERCLFRLTGEMRECFKNRAEVKTIARFHEKLHVFLKEKKHKELVAQITRTLEEKFLLKKLSFVDNFIYAMKKAYGKSSRKFYSKEEGFDWYFEEFIILYLQGYYFLGNGYFAWKQLEKENSILSRKLKKVSVYKILQPLLWSLEKELRPKVPLPEEIWQERTVFNASGLKLAKEFAGFEKVINKYKSWKKSQINPTLTVKAKKVFLEYGRNGLGRESGRIGWAKLIRNTLVANQKTKKAIDE